MPFYNVTPEEARSISTFTQRHRTRTKMTFIGGQSAPVKTDTEDLTAEGTPYIDHAVGVLEGVMLRYAMTCSSTAETTKSDKRETEGAALHPQQKPQEEEKDDDEGDGHNTAERPYPFPSLFLHTPQKFARLHLALSDAAAQRTAKADQTKQPPALDRTVAAGLSESYCTPHLPPHELLYTAPRTASCAATPGSSGYGEKTSSGATAASMVPAPLSYSTAENFPAELHRHSAPVQMNPSLRAARPMVNLSLTPSPHDTSSSSSSTSPSSYHASTAEAAAPVQHMTQVVLQGEAALLVSGPSSGGDVDAKEQGDSDSSNEKVEKRNDDDADAAAAAAIAGAAAAALRDAPFLVSPDATSCVIVACRVTLNPSLIDAWCSVSADARGAALSSLTSASMPAPHLRLVEGFVQACVRTATAAMAHLDRADGVAGLLRDMVWNSAAPAFVHAVDDHYNQIALQRAATEDDSRPVAAVGTALALLQQALAAVWQSARTSSSSSSSSSLPSPLAGDAASSLLHVEWYVVGGVRMKTAAAPVVAAILRAFFPSSTCNRSDNTARAATTAPEGEQEEGDAQEGEEGTPLLQEAVPLSSLLLTTATAVASPLTLPALRVSHRLREDGLCFWSFNTTFQPWCVDPRPTQRYAYPLTWGLLLSVASGHCWPATVQPGTRQIALLEMRHAMVQGGYSWTTPLESDGVATAQEDGDEKGDSKQAGLLLMRNAVPSLLVAQQANKQRRVASPLWSELTTVQSTATDGSAACSSGLDTLCMTLQCYVRTLLDRQREWWWQRRASAASPAEALPLRRRTLPLVLRSHRHALTSASSPPPTTDHSDHDKNSTRRGRQRDTVQVHWNKIPSAAVKDVLKQPKAHCFNFSTTPHCEPPDFCDVLRSNLPWMAMVGPEDVFVKFTDGLYVE